MQQVRDEDGQVDDSARSVATLLDALPSGSYLVASHATNEHSPPGDSGAGVSAYQASGIPF